MYYNNYGTTLQVFLGDYRSEFSGTTNKTTIYPMYYIDANTGTLYPNNGGGGVKFTLSAGEDSIFMQPSFAILFKLYKE